MRGAATERWGNVEIPVVSRSAEEAATPGDVLEGFPEDGALRRTFHEVWGHLEEEVEVSLTSEEALQLFPSLVVYNMPDGTRSTLTVDSRVEVEEDAGLYCVGLIHVLRALGARTCVIMTHTSYNRARGAAGMQRILRVVARGSRPLQRYAKARGVDVRWVGMRPGYELQAQLARDFPPRTGATFQANLLVDYDEELGDDPAGRSQLARLPEVDVCVRHTKLNMSGGWIPGKLRRSSFVYCQNGTLFSNWSFSDLVALATVSLLSKVLHQGEGLGKMYGDVDEVKRRFQLRELRLFNREVRLRPKPTKLFLMGSPFGLYQIYF